MMASILMTIGVLCRTIGGECQKKYITCVRDKMSENHGSKTNADEYLWECSVELSTKG